MMGAVNPYKPYKVLDVCRHVINYSNDAEYNISNLKLQKILYFIQAEFLVDFGIPCFMEHMEAWNFGPVVPVAYREYKCFGANPIPRISKFVEYKPHCIIYTQFIDNIITDEHKSIIDDILDYFADYSASELVDITHKQEPWIDAYHSNNRIIDNNAIEGFFRRYASRT